MIRYSMEIGCSLCHHRSLLTKFSLTAEADSNKVSPAPRRVDIRSFLVRPVMLSKTKRFATGPRNLTRENFTMSDQPHNGPAENSRTAQSNGSNPKKHSERRMKKPLDDLAKTSLFFFIYAGICFFSL